MERLSPTLFLATLATALAAISWLLFRLLAYLRRTPQRYRWFELFAGGFMVVIGFFVLIKWPQDHWRWWTPLFAGWSILSGGYWLGQLVVLRFTRALGGDGRRA